MVKLISKVLGERSEDSESIEKGAVSPGQRDD